VLTAMTRRRRIAAWIVNDFSFSKKGSHSVGVTRQQYGLISKKKNCRIAVGVSMATAAASLPVTFSLYLPENWTGDKARRQEAGVPVEIVFQSRQEIALDQLRLMIEEDVARAPVVADVAYGDDQQFREGLEEMGLAYCVEIQPSTAVCLPAFTTPLSQSPKKAGRPSKTAQWDDRRPSLSVKELASCLCEADQRRIGWRKDAQGITYSHFARLRVHAASYRDHKQNKQPPERWLLVEWLTAERKPMKSWLSNLPESIDLQQLVNIAKMSWIAERDCDELKHTLGLDHYEGRNWRGFHHHATLCIAAYGFQVIERHLASIAGREIAA
jgi:SRSO17 transposase